MSSKPTTTNKTLLNPIFAVPAGAEEEFVYTDDTILTGAAGTDEQFDAQEYGQDIEESTENDDYYDDYGQSIDALETPTDFVVLSQTLRRAPGGQQVVDIIIEAEDIGGAVNYEFQVSKV